MKHFGASDLVGEANDTRNFMQGLGVHTPAPPAHGCCGKGWCQHPRGDGSSLPCVPQGAHSSFPVYRRVPTAPALRPGSLLLNSVGCPDVRDEALGEVPAQTTLTAHSHRPSKGQSHAWV